MRFYTPSHRFYCGVDLHTSTMDLVILDHDGHVVFDQDLPADEAAFLDAVAPFRDGLVVGVECMFAWYWLADRCAREQIAFVLGHALSLKAIHGGKSKTDRIDAGKLARLLRGGNFPLAYAYPKGLRETRDRLRRRMDLVRRRAEAFPHIPIANSQYNLPPFSKKLTYARNRVEAQILERFTDPRVNKNSALDLALIERYDELIADVELYLTRTAKVQEPQTYHRLQTIPGVGKILALVLLYEIHDIRRFPEVGPFLSYARLVRCQHTSAGKVQRTGGKQQKIGNAYLKWAFSEAVCLFLRSCPAVKAWHRRPEKKRGSKRAKALLAAKRGRAVSLMLRRKEAFDLQRFLAS